MTSKPTVTLTFAGDSTQLEAAADRASAATRRVSESAGESSRAMQDAGTSVERYTEQSDTAEQRSQGFADVLTGVTEGFAALNDDSLSATEKMIALGGAGADLAGGFTAFLIPVIGQLGTALKTGLGGAMSFVAAHPVMFALLALAAVFVLLWMNSETFREIVMKVFDAVASFTTKTLGAAWDWVVDKWNWLVGAVQGGADRVSGFFSGIGEGIKNAFRGAFNFVADAWNNTAGRLGFTIPGWVPGIGGGSFSMPRIPKFHTGGVVPGAIGTEVLAVLQAGERVSAVGQGGPLVMTFSGDLDSALATAIMELFRTGKIQLGDGTG